MSDLEDEFSDLPRIMTSQEVADLLRTTPLVITRLAQRGELPGKRVGKRWVFRRSAVIAYLTGAEQPGDSDDDK